MKFAASYGAWALFFMEHVRSIPVSTDKNPVAPMPRARVLEEWENTLSSDTRHRLDMALQHLGDETALGQAFRNDTIMR